MKHLKNYLSKENILKGIIACGFIVFVYMVCFLVDNIMQTEVWKERFWNVGLSGVVVAIACAIISIRKK